jgi:hypothetical protein
MLPRIILTLLQLHIGWTYGPQLRALVPFNIGQFNIFILALIIAVLVWLVGHLGALVLKETPAPTSATLTVVLLLAVIFAGLTLVPAVPAFVNGTLRLAIPLVAYPLIGAVLGYLIKK